MENGKRARQSRSRPWHRGSHCVFSKFLSPLWGRGTAWARASSSERRRVLGLVSGTLTLPSEAMPQEVPPPPRGREKAAGRKGVLRLWWKTFGFV